MPPTYVNPNKAFQEQGASVYAPTTTPISADVLNTPKLPALPQAPTPSPVAFPTLPSVQDIMAQTSGDTALSKAFTDTTVQTADTSAAIAGETGYRATQETTYDLSGKKKTVNDLTNRFNGLKAQADQIPLQIQQDFTGRGATAGGVAPIQTGELRNNAIQQIGISAMLNAANGDLATAQDQVDYAVKAKFEPLKAQLAAQTAQLAALTPLLAREDKKRAEAQSALLDERSRLLNKAEAEQNNINSVMLTAAKFNADAKTLTGIQNAGSYAEAIAAAGQYIQDPKAKYDLESARLDNILKQQQITKTQKEIAQIGQPTLTQQAENVKAQQAAKDAIPAITDKISNISTLLNSPGLNSAVGPNALGRFAIADRFGAKQNFIAGVQQLVSKDTLDTLINLKAQGGTLGALSDQERIMLQSAASKIGTWAIRDSGGNVTGYNVDEGSFKAELQTIQTLSERARDKALGNAGLVSKDEQAAIQQLLSTSTLTSTPATSLSPASYF